MQRTRVWKKSKHLCPECKKVMMHPATGKRGSMITYSQEMCCTTLGCKKIYVLMQASASIQQPIGQNNEVK